MKDEVCFGWNWRSIGCLIDRALGCRWRRVCDWHDSLIWKSVGNP